MGMKSVRELTDASIEHDMLNYMEKLIRNVEGVVEARKIRYPAGRSSFAAAVVLSGHSSVYGGHRARKMGTYSIVDVKIQVDHLLSVSAAHQVAKRVRLTLLDAVPQVNDVMVRTTQPTSHAPTRTAFPAHATSFRRRGPFQVHVDPEPPQSQTLQTLMRPQSEIYQDVVAKVDLFPEVRQPSAPHHATPHHARTY
jgi:hypothetical protein